MTLKVVVMRSQLVSMIQICIREITGEEDAEKCLAAARDRVARMEQLAARWPE